MKRYVYALGMLAVSASASYAATFYSDLVSFQNATTNLSVDSFEDDPRFITSDPIVRDDFTMEETGDTFFGTNQIGIGSPVFVGFGAVSGTGGAAYNPADTSVLNLTDFTAGTTAVGFWISSDFLPDPGTQDCQCRSKIPQNCRSNFPHFRDLVTSQIRGLS
jgi:hypothetical protein